MIPMARRLRAGWLLLLLGMAGCGEVQYGFHTGARFEPLVVEPDTRGSQCLDELRAADAVVQPAPADVAARAVALGGLAERGFRQQERRRQRDWDQYFCRREAECMTLAHPHSSMLVIDQHLEVCLAERAQRRVAMEL